MGSSASSKALATGEFDSQLVAAMRLVLTSVVLFITGPVDIIFDPFNIISTLYTLYSAVLFLFARKVTRLLSSPIAYWADLVWAALLIGLGEPSSSAFLLLFPITLASFQRGFFTAQRVTAVGATLLFGSLVLDEKPEFSLFEISLSPLYVLVFGYLVGRWGEREITSKRRLMLLKEITILSNPRFGIDRTIANMMEQLRAFYNADSCLMVTEAAANEYLLRHVTRRDVALATEGQSIAQETAALLIAPFENALLYYGAPSTWQRWRSSREICFSVDAGNTVSIVTSPAVNETLITTLEAGSFISVPLHNRTSTTGRLYLTSVRRRAFSLADVGFLFQVVEQIIPVIDNIRLLDQLASSAAEEERRRLAHDMHDNVIQPYIGLRIALATVSQKLQSGAADISHDISKLIALTDQGIAALRHYVYWLMGAGKRESVLLGTLWRFIATFSETTNIAVQIEATSDLSINDRLAAEVYQMIVEGLSNIRRHTNAASASIGLARQNDCIIVRIINDGADPEGSAGFIPRSISERAAALGGHLSVEHIDGGSTQVTVEIPL
jgi:signal transduction histidine kinase